MPAPIKSYNTVSLPKYTQTKQSNLYWRKYIIPGNINMYIPRGIAFSDSKNLSK